MILGNPSIQGTAGLSASVPGSIKKWIHLERHLAAWTGQPGVRTNQHGLVNGKSCYSHLKTFSDKVTHLVEEGRAVDVVYPELSQAFDTVSHSMEKLAAHSLDACTSSLLDSQRQSGGEWS